MRLTDTGMNGKASRDRALPWAGWIGECIPSIILLFYTGYVYLYAVNSNWLGDRVLFIMACLGVGGLALRKNAVMLRPILVFSVAFVFLAGVGVLFPTTPFADQGWFFSAVFRLFLAVVLIHAFQDFSVRQSDRRLAGAGVVVLCFFFVNTLLGYAGINLKTELDLLPMLKVSAIDWSDKYISFWLFFLLWATVIALLNRRSRQNSMIALVMIVVTGWVLVDFGSEVAVVAWLAGSLVFGVLLLVPEKWQRLLTWSIAAVFLLLPLAGVLSKPFAFVDPESIVTVLYDFNRDVFHLLGSRGIHSIAARLHLFDISSQLLQTNWITGYGFGSELSLPVVSQGFTSWHTLPGGHPHNIVFLFFIQMGVFGYLFFSATVMAVFHAVLGAREQADAVSTAPAVAMLTGACIIFSTSFSAWKPDMILLYSMVAGVLLMSGAVQPGSRTRLFESVLAGIAALGILASFIGFLLD